MHIVVISNNYPSNRTPNRGAFVFNLVQEFSKLHQVTVIAPRKLSEILNFKKKSSYGVERTLVYRPLYLSLGNRRVLGVDLGVVSFVFMKWAIEWTLRKHIGVPSVIYCHFLINALASMEYAKKYNIPLVAASGESRYDHLKIFKKNKIENLIQNLKFVICVSAANQSYLESVGYSRKKIRVLPNTVDFSVFRPYDKVSAKRQLGISEEEFVIGFIGHFIERKGPNRLIQSIDKMVNKDKIKAVFVGAGEPLLERDYVIKMSPQPNHLLPKIIGAFDVFVLPTLSEGHCNVIEEVKACCVPVISSKGTTVEQQLNDGRGVLVDPTSIEEISAAILELRANESKRQEISNLLMSQRSKYTLADRATKICIILERLI